MSLQETADVAEFASKFGITFYQAEHFFRSLLVPFYLRLYS
jgi:hypothetical protein